MKRCDPEQTNQRLKEKEGVEGQCDQVLQKLKALSNPKAVGGMACYGINPKNTYGVSIPNLRKMAKEIGVDHDLAQELWTSAIHEARILASMIDDPKTATEEQMERWAIDFDSWDTCDQCCMNLIEGHSSVEFGMTLTTVEPGVAAPFEPKASAPNDRIRVLSKANDIGIRTFIFLGPLLPFVSDRGNNLDELLDVVAGINPDYFLVDRLNPRYGIWPAVSATLSRYDPEPIPKYQNIPYHKHTCPAYVQTRPQNPAGGETTRYGRQDAIQFLIVETVIGAAAPRSEYWLPLLVSE